MLWLILQMGGLLGIAAVFGTVIGWGIRGILLKGKTRRAIVERDIALTELDQTRTELDGLYAAQKSGVTAAAEAGDATLKRELQAREEKVHSLTSALAASQEQLEKLKTIGAAGVVGVGAAALAGKAAQSDASASDDRLDGPIHQPSAELEWRNRYLESRVRTLESKMESLGADLVSAEKAAADATAQMATASAASVDSAALSDASAEERGVEAEKLGWMNNYLTMRAGFLAENPIGDRDQLYAVTGADKDDDHSNGADVEADPVSDVPAPAVGKTAGELEQELARLRWRNRYLEGRLAYIEGDVERSEEAVKETSSAPSGLIGAPVSSAGADGTAKPPTLERPEDDGDDLTQIRGITQDVKSALNEIGVWRFTQIASWSKENVAWISEHVSAKGDKNHQDWVSQADVLAKGGGSA